MREESPEYSLEIGQLRVMRLGGPRNETGDLQLQSATPTCVDNKTVSTESCGALALEICGLAAAFGRAKLEW